MNNRNMNRKLNLEELEMVNGGIWDVIFDIFNESCKVVDEKYIEPAINKVVISTNKVVDDIVDEAAQLGYKIYDAI